MALFLFRYGLGAIFLYMFLSALVFADALKEDGEKTSLHVLTARNRTVRIESLSKKTRTRRAFVRLGACKSVLKGNCEKNNITFVLFTKNKSNIGEKITFSKDRQITNLVNTSFNSSAPTKMIIHGYNADMCMDDLVEIKNQYLIAGDDLNVIAVDWSAVSQGPCYSSAVWNSRFAGKCTADLAKEIRRLTSESEAELHLIGFSLGAHVAGFVAKSLIAMTNDKLERITGLDPAGPGFILGGDESRLDIKDAHFVDIIHTNALFMGRMPQSGHLDFYVNGGTFQKGCGFSIFNCNHHRAAKYFAESINTKTGFWGRPCNSIWTYFFGLCSVHKLTIPMGEKADPFSRGVFFVTTKDSAPFALGIS